MCGGEGASSLALATITQLVVNWGGLSLVEPNRGVTPYGACRQVLGEFVDPNVDAVVWMGDREGNVRETTLFTRMLDHFGPPHLV